MYPVMTLADKEKSARLGLAASTRRFRSHPFHDTTSTNLPHRRTAEIGDCERPQRNLDREIATAHAGPTGGLVPPVRPRSQRSRTAPRLARQSSRPRARADI